MLISHRLVQHGRARALLLVSLVLLVPPERRSQIYFERLFIILALVTFTGQQPQHATPHFCVPDISTHRGAFIIVEA